MMLTHLPLLDLCPVSPGPGSPERWPLAVWQSGANTHCEVTPTPLTDTISAASTAQTVFLFCPFVRSFQFLFCQAFHFCSANITNFLGRATPQAPLWSNCTSTYLCISIQEVCDAWVVTELVRCPRSGYLHLCITGSISVRCRVWFTGHRDGWDTLDMATPPLLTLPGSGQIYPTMFAKIHSICMCFIYKTWQMI